MRLSASILLLAAATATMCFAQSAPKTQTIRPSGVPSPSGAQQTQMQGQDLEPLDQTGCPVVFASASLDAPVRYLPISDAIRPTVSPSLNLNFRNMSGKGIKSAILKVDVTMKKSIYDLDSTTLSVDLMLSGIEISESALTRRLPLPVPVLGLARVTLVQVRYQDGSLWTASRNRTCSVNAGTLLRAN